MRLSNAFFVFGLVFRALMRSTLALDFRACVSHPERALNPRLGFFGLCLAFRLDTRFGVLACVLPSARHSRSYGLGLDFDLRLIPDSEFVLFDYDFSERRKKHG